MPVVTDLYVYPVNSCAGIRVSSADLWETGLYLDRLWMVVGEDGRFLSQRTVPRLALISTALRFETLQLRAPGMLRASVLHPPFGHRLAALDSAAAERIAGVRRVVRIDPLPSPLHLRQGVAVVADSTWAAIQGVRALQATWERAPGPPVDSEAIRDAMHQAVLRPGEPVRSEGDVDRALAGAARVVEATYELPLLAHVPMEPINCLADVRPGRAEVWGPMQDPDGVRELTARVTGIPITAITVHMMRSGGGFGRRLMSDYGAEAAYLSKAMGAPVQVLRTREEDLSQDFFRPCAVHRLRAVFAEDEERVRGEGRKASSLLRLLAALRARPLTTITDLSRRSGVSFPTAAGGAEKLVALGIARELTGRERHRIFAYDRYLAILGEGGEPL